MSMFRNTRHVVILLIVVLLMSVTASAVFAGDDGGEGNVDLKVLHRINAEDGLPVDVCVNGSYAFTFVFGDTVNTVIPAGEYTFEVFLEADKNERCAGDPVLSAGPAELPAGSKVVAKAGIKGEEPVLAVMIYEKKDKK